MDIKYLKLLSKKFPDIKKASCEKINLQAILKLPKGTEYFFSDLHGEYEGFINLLRRASGVNRNKIDDIFENDLSIEERKNLAYLVAYTREYLNNLNINANEKREWYKIQVSRLIKLLKLVSGKYSRSKVRKNLPSDFAYILDELLGENEFENRGNYYNEIIKSLVESEIIEEFIIEVCRTIRSFTVDKLHIIGDIFDRGPRPDIIIDELIAFHDVDIQWGNHDISWMGAYCGNKALIANVVRIAMGYKTIDVLENGYGINLRALSIFASDVYKNDDCIKFKPKKLDRNVFDEVDDNLTAKMGKAITVIQLKLEGQLIMKHPEWKMDDRLLLNRINYEDYTIDIDGITYKLNTNNLPTINPKDPYKLTEGEEEVIRTISSTFMNSKRLSEHIEFLYRNGSSYLIYNGNLLFHGCMPFKDNGEFLPLVLNNESYSGKKLYDYIEFTVKDAYLNRKTSDESVDFMWYLWAGPVSPFFGKSKIAMFEQKFLDDKDVAHEVMNSYFNLTYNEDICKKILDEFNVNYDRGHIINGHVPVKMKDGQHPVRANGKLFVIDGGLAKAYQTKTGMAGYTLIINSNDITLSEHHVDTLPKIAKINVFNERLLIEDTSEGESIIQKINDLDELIKAYKLGIIK